MDLNQIAKNKQNFATKQVGGDLVLVPIKDNVAEMNAMFTLNEVGSFVWDNLKEESTRELLSLAIAEEFDVDQATAKADLEEFLLQIQDMVNG